MDRLRAKEKPFLTNASIKRFVYFLNEFDVLRLPVFDETGLGFTVDLQFEKFGAKRVVPLRKCDVDYEEEAMEWFGNVLNVIENQAVEKPVAPQQQPVKKATGKKYYQGTVLANINLK